MSSQPSPLPTTSAGASHEDEVELGDNLPLEDWLARVLDPKRNRARLNTYNFPTDAHRNEYLRTVAKRTDREVRSLLRSFLIQSGSIGHDRMTLAYLAHCQKAGQPWPKTEFTLRLVAWLRSKGRIQPWEGVTWVLDLLPDSPQQAINVLDAYLDAHAWYMPDGRLAGLGDARAIIRAKYILVGDIENCERVMSQLASREFEVLLCELYKARGYRTRLTPPSKDGGFDVLAVKGGSGHREHCLVECKHHRNPVGVKDARALLQVVTQRRATKGVLVSSSKFTAGTRALAASNRQLDLVDRRALLKLLNQHLGANWPLTVDHLIAKEAQVRLRIPTHSITQSDRIRSWFRAFDQRSERSDEYGN